MTEWHCKNRVSNYADNWQDTPNQGISSRSWTGKTWLFPKGPVDSKRAKIQAVVANARQEKCLLKGVEAAELMMEGIPKESRDFLHAMLSKVEVADHSEARKKVNRDSRVMFEFCCSNTSSLGSVNASKGIAHFRLSRDVTDLPNEEDVKS